MTAELCSPREELTRLSAGEINGPVFLSGLEQRHCHPLHKNNPLPPLEMDPLEKTGGNGRSVARELIKYRLFLRCRFFYSWKNDGGGELNPNLLGMN